MASKKRWAHLRKYWFKKKGRKGRKRTKTKHKRKARHMARKRKGSRRRGGGRRRYHGRRRTHRRRHSGGTSGRGVAAIKQDMALLAAAGVYGFLEAKSKSDTSFFLNKLPKPVAQLGFAGNTALALYLATMVTPNKYVRLSARAVAMVAVYQLGKNGGAFTSGTQILGELDDGEDERIIDAHLMGALDAEGTRDTDDSSSGLKYDDVVREAQGRV